MNTPDATTDKQPIRCSRVQISQKGIARLSGEEIIESIERDGILEIVLGYGRAGGHTGIVAAGWVLIGFGIILAILPLARIIWHKDYPASPMALKSLGYAAVSVLIGLYLIKDLFKRRYYLSVKTRDGNHKIVFDDRISAAEVNDFAARAGSDFGYAIAVKANH